MAAVSSVGDRGDDDDERQFCDGLPCPPWDDHFINSLDMHIVADYCPTHILDDLDRFFNDHTDVDDILTMAPALAPAPAPTPAPTPTPASASSLKRKVEREMQGQGLIRGRKDSKLSKNAKEELAPGMLQKPSKRKSIDHGNTAEVQQPKNPKMAKLEQESTQQKIQVAGKKKMKKNSIDKHKRGPCKTRNTARGRILAKLKIKSR